MDVSKTSMGPPPLPSPMQEASDPLSRRESKRSSLTFQLPAQPNADSGRPRPSSIISASPISSRPLSPTEPSVETDPNAFLTQLAAQERRVLELKEELQKAEMDLSKLKTKWAVHEATKKRNEIHRVEPLREMVTPGRTSFEVAGLQRSRTSVEDERKKAMYIRTKQPQRKVFAGGRHTRALSLLSLGALSDSARSPTSPMISGTEEIRRMPLSAGAVSGSHSRAYTQGSNRDIVHTGKQIVGDLREGLWTFIEDLKSATVGDEARTAAMGKQPLGVTHRVHTPRRRSPMTETPKSTMITEDGHSDFISDHIKSPGPGDTPRQTVLNKSATPPDYSKDPMIDEDDDGWDNWDSPPPKTSDSTTFSLTAGSSPRTSVSSTGSKGNGLEVEPRASSEIPWPALTKLHPGNLTRTASHLMAEWERSLTPPPDERGTRPVSPLEVEKEQKAD